MALPAELHARLARLVRTRRTAALGTLRAAAPCVSMVPYALAADGSGFLIHVSTLAAHTKDMLADARVGLLISAPEDAAATPLALERVSVQARAAKIAADAAGIAALRAAYLARFPDAEPMFGFADFALFLLRPESVRFVAGFGQAHSLSAETLTEILRRES